MYGINYAPELTGIGKYSGEMATWLAGRGHEIRVISAPPFSPGWRIYEGFSGWRYVREQVGQNSPEVLRCPVWVPQRPAGLNRLLHLLSFGLSSVPAIIKSIRWRPDLVWVVEPSCVFLPAALFLARATSAKAWLHVQDFEVDMAFQLGLLPACLTKTVLRFERMITSRFDRVSTISDRMMELLQTKRTRTDGCVLFPNWVDTTLIYPRRQPSPMRAELGIPDAAVVALYSGNIARKQGIEVLVEALRLVTAQSGIHVVICGDGPARPLFDSLGQLPNAHLMPLQPLDRLNDLLNLADIHLLPQRAGAADLVMPSKLTGMLASGRPVIATVCPGTQVATVVQGCGVIVPPGDADALSKAIIDLALDPIRRGNLGAAARAYAVRHLSAERLLANFEREAESLCGATPNRISAAAKDSVC